MTTPTTADLLRSAVEERLADVWTCLPAYVSKVYADRGHQFVDVIPALTRPIRTEDGELQPEELPQVTGVPVAHLQGGGFFVSVPLAVGDVVTLVFAQWSIDQWTESGERGSAAPVTSAATGLHSPSGAIAFPSGPMPVPSLLKDVSPDKLVIARDGAERIEMGGGQVTIICPKIKLDGEVTVTGAIVAESTIDAKDAIASKAEVTANDGGAQSVTLSGHTHPHPFGETSPARSGT